MTYLKIILKLLINRRIKSSAGKLESSPNREWGDEAPNCGLDNWSLATHKHCKNVIYLINFYTAPLSEPQIWFHIINLYTSPLQMNDNISAYLLTNETNKREQKKTFNFRWQNENFLNCYLSLVSKFRPVNTSYEYEIMKKTIFKKRRTADRNVKCRKNS